MSGRAGRELVAATAAVVVDVGGRTSVLDSEMPVVDAWGALLEDLEGVPLTCVGTSMSMACITAAGISHTSCGDGRHMESTPAQNSGDPLCLMCFALHPQLHLQ